MRKRRPRQHPFFDIRSLKKYLITTLLILIIGSTVTTQYLEKPLQLLTDGIPALYSNQNNDDLTQTFVQAINSAKSSVLLIVYSLTDANIISSLRSKSQEGINVKVICDAKASPYIDSKLGSKISTTRRFGPGLMHQKILVVDNKHIWLGSANMTSESLSLHGNLVTAMESLDLANAITTKAQTLKIEGKTTPISHEDFFIGGQKVELWFLPDNKDAIRRLKSLIHSAEKTIRVAMFTWTRQDLANAIIHAAKRGVQAEVVIDHYSAKGASAKIVKLLKDNGVNVSISPGGALLHHKFLYIDNEVLVNGSANWTKAAFTQNDDCFVVLHNLSSEQNKRMESLWHTISTEAIKY